MKRNVNIWARLDKISILIFVLMLIMGWFNIYAAVFNEEHSRILDMSQRYGKQFAWIIAAIVVAVFVVVIDTRFYLFFSYFIYGSLMFLLVLVLFLGRDINGARSWFEFGSFTFQPSEFAKFGTALALAAYLNQKKLDLKKPSVFFTSSALILLPALLIALQPDMGSTVVFLAFFIVLFREGMSPYITITGVLMVVLFFFRFLFNNVYLISGLIGIAFLLAWLTTKKTREILLGVVIFSLITAFLYFLRSFVFRSLDDERLLLAALLISGMAYAFHFYSKKAKSYIVIFVFLVASVAYINSVDYVFDRILKPHQKERVEIMLGIKSDPRGTGYNVNQSIISIGSGGFLGKGYLKGTQTKFKFVPAQSTDFIFCTIGEEWGFAGSFLVIGLYVFLLLRLVFLAERQRSFFSRIYGYGVVSVLFIHFFINTGMTIGMVPVIGIPLPFFSYGGSSLIGFTILLFIFLRLDASRTEYLF